MPKIRYTYQQRLSNNIPLDLSLPKTLKDAVIARDYASVRRLLQKGDNPNTQDDEGLTPLHFAVKDNRLYIASLLLQYDASILIEDKIGHTPLDYTLIFKYKCLQNLFEKKLNNMNRRNSYYFFAKNKFSVSADNKSIENNINLSSLR